MTGHPVAPAVRAATTLAPGWTTVVGTREELGALVRAARATGLAVAHTVPVSVAGERGRYLLRLRVVEPVPVRRRSRRRVVAVSGAAAAVVLLAMLCAAAAVVVAHLLAILTALAVVALVLFGLGQASACPGIHCPGCRHR